jgi:hypothetical protein
MLEGTPATALSHTHRFHEEKRLVQYSVCMVKTKPDVSDSL